MERHYMKKVLLICSIIGFSFSVHAMDYLQEKYTQLMQDYISKKTELERVYDVAPNHPDAIKLKQAIEHIIAEIDQINLAVVSDHKRTYQRRHSLISQIKLKN